MTSTIFDLVEEEPKPGKEGFFQYAMSFLPPPPEGMERAHEYEKSALKGIIEGFHQAGRAFGPLDAKIPQQEEGSELLEELLPTEDESFGQKAIRRGLKEAPTAALTAPAGPLAMLPRAMAAGFLGEGAKDLGAPEWAQSAAELTAYLSPDIIRKLLSSGKDKEIIDAARKFGMSDEQITPLIQSDFKKKWLSKISPKRGSTQTALRSSKEKLSEAYGTLQKSETAQQLLPVDAVEEFLNSSRKVLEEIPSSVRNTIKQDFVDLLKKPVTGDSLINLYGDLNHALSANKKQLTLLKKPIKEALGKIAPELAEDFEMINKLHVRYYDIASKLKPRLADDIVSAAETIGLFGSAITGYYPTLFTMLGEQGVKKLAQQMLINPRLQQLSKKTIESMNQNKFASVATLMKMYKQELAKSNPEIAEQFPEMTEEELREFLNPKR